jgi:TetR/AcrR family transcriptional regulator, transcriptional repressor for nem operon
MYGRGMDARERLIESTRELLWERGYVGMSPRAIQQRAGAGQGSMYHHFAGKSDLALAAVRRTAEDMRTQAEGELSGPGAAYERIESYLLREREVLRGCPVGRLTQDPDVIADPVLRRPLEETFDWLRSRLARVLAEGRERGELARDLDAATTAATVVATLQGGYVLARAAASAEPFEQAIRGILALLAAQRTSVTATTGPATASRTATDSTTTDSAKAGPAASGPA